MNVRLYPQCVPFKPNYTRTMFTTQNIIDMLKTFDQIVIKQNTRGSFYAPRKFISCLEFFFESIFIKFPLL